MSHFGVLVLLTDRPDDLSAAVEAVLAPYDENLEVEEYEKECWCVGREAEHRGIVVANERTQFEQRLESARAAVQEHTARVKAAGGSEDDGWSASTALVQRADERAALEAEKAQLDARWQAIFEERDAIASDVAKADPQYGKPEAGCDYCHGTGRERTTSNPQGFWDWWVVGGRWAGALNPEYDPNADPRNFAPCRLCSGTGKRDDTLGRQARAADPSYGCNGCDSTGTARNWDNAEFPGDVKPVAALPEALPFYAIVTPDGQWHQRGKMLMFGVSRDDMDDATWDAYKRAEIAKHPDAWAVVVDCHV